MSDEKLMQLYLSAFEYYKMGLESAKKMNKPSLQVLSCVSHASVCFSFAAELLLKLIIYNNNSETKKHYLNILFNNLTEKQRALIELKYKEFMLNPREDLKIISYGSYNDSNLTLKRKSKYNMNDMPFEEMLELHSDSFIKWRYSFEIEENKMLEFNFKAMDSFIKSLLLEVRNYNFYKNVKLKKL